MDQYIGVSEAAKILGLEYYQVLYRIKTGQLPAIKAGWVWLIKRSDVEKL